MGDVTLDDVEAALLSHPEPVVTVGDLDDHLDCSDRHLLTLLRSLEHSGTVQSKQTGARAVAWWHTARVRPPQPTVATTRTPGETSPAADSEPDEHPADSPAPDLSAPDTEPESDATDDPPTTDEIEQAVDAAVEHWEDSEDRIEARKAAARGVLSALRERPLSKSEIIEEFYPEYAVDGQSEDTWWRKNLAECTQAPLKALADYNRGTHKWEM